MNKRQTQRVKAMLEGFMDDHKDGLGIPEIAIKYGISTTTIYHTYLQEIADANDMERSELLERIHSKHQFTCSGSREAADFDEVINLSAALSSDISQLLKTIEEETI